MLGVLLHDTSAHDHLETLKPPVAVVCVVCEAPAAEGARDGPWGSRRACVPLQPPRGLTLRALLWPRWRRVGRRVAQAPWEAQGRQPCPRRVRGAVGRAQSWCRWRCPSVSLSHVAEAGRQGLRGRRALLFQPSLGLRRDAPGESPWCPGAGGCRVPVRTCCGWSRARRSVGRSRTCCLGPAFGRTSCCSLSGPVLRMSREALGRVSAFPAEPQAGP